MSVSIIEVKTPKISNTTNLYELNADTFQLPEGIILLDILHRVDHKTPQHLDIPILNVKNVQCSIGKNIPIASMCPVGEVQWGLGDQLDQAPVWQLLLKTPQNTSLQLELDIKVLASSIPDADISEEAK